MAAKTGVVIDDFSGGMKGRKGQYTRQDAKALQDINNMYVGRDGSIIQRNKTVTNPNIPSNLLRNDKVLTFEKGGHLYYLVYDTLLKGRLL